MKTVRFGIFTALLVSATAYAQMGGPPPGGPGPHGEFGPGGFGFGMHPGKVVTGAPYTATATNVFTQTLSGGNTIQRTTTAQVARDTQGRTYEQQTVSSGPLAQNGPTSITFISDPVAGYIYVLNPTTMVATRRAIKAGPAGAPSGPPTGAGGPRAHGGGDANVVETDLGTQSINGVSAQGKSVTRTIPAGARGNAQPIVSTSTTWYSPDLQIVISATHNDPQGGQSTYSLASIQTTAPAASLFQVPSTYTVQDAPTGRGPRGAGAWGRPPIQ